jgi:hypothetical protein
MAIGIDNDADGPWRGSIPSGGAGTLTDGGFAGFFVGVWVYRPTSGNSYGLTAEGYIISGVAGAREIKLGYDNTFGSGTAGDPLLQVIFNSGGGTGATQTFAGANIFDEWVYYFFCADSTNQYVGYIRYADLGGSITDSITRANDNAGSQYINTLALGNYGSGGSAVMGHYAYARARYGNHDLTDVMALAQSSAPDAGDWGFWPLDNNTDTGDDSGNARDFTFAGTLTTETSPTLGGGGPTMKIFAYRQRR